MIFSHEIAPFLMGQQFLTLSPQYNSMLVIQPRTRHDFAAARTKIVEFNQFKRWGTRAATKSQRRRDKLSVIGTVNSVGLASKQFRMEIAEFTGPSTVEGDPASLWITLEDLRYARALLMQEGIETFHESIGSRNMADDYNSTLDRLCVNEVMNTVVKLNPGGKVDAATLVTDKATSADLDRAVFQLMTNNTPVFSDGLYHALCDLTFMFQLMQDPDFKQSAFAFHQNAQVPVGSQMGQGLLPSMLRTGSPGAQVPMGMPGPGQPVSQVVPILYKNLLLFPSNNLPKRVINGLEASLCLAFGPDAVAYGSGGKGVELKRHNDTDYNRHFRYIWSQFFDMIYAISDDDSSGCSVEMRTFGLV